MNKNEELDYLKSKANDYEDFIDLQNDLLSVLANESEYIYKTLSNEFDFLQRNKEEKIAQREINILNNILKMKKKNDKTREALINEFKTTDEYISRFSKLKNEKSELEEDLKRVKQQIEIQQNKLIELMTEEEIQNFKDKNGVTFSLKTTIIPNVLAENKVALVEALKENGYEGLVKEEVNAQTFKSFVKEQGWETTEELPEYLQNIVSLYEKTTIGTRRA